MPLTFMIIHTCHCYNRPYIVYDVGINSRFMSEPRSSHFIATKTLMRCIKGTLDYDILFLGNANGATMNLIAYFDVDWC